MDTVLEYLTAERVVYISAIATLFYVALYTRYQHRLVSERLSLLCDFMAYLRDNVEDLPKDVAFNYDACFRQSMKILQKQGVAPTGKLGE